MATAKELEAGILKAHSFLKGYSLNLCRDTEKAADLYQETVCKALENADKFQLGTNLEAWLSTIMFNQLLHWRRKEGRYDQLEDQDVPIDQDFNSTMVLEKVAAALEKLPKGWGEQLVEHVVEGKTLVQIATELGKPANTVKTQLFRTRERLKKELEDII